MENRLFEFTVRLLRGEGCDLPPDARGAYAPCYASASDYQSAVKRAVSAIGAMHFVFDDIRGNVREIPLDAWEDYVAKVWPDFSDHFPAQSDLPELIEKGVVFFGPFATFSD